MLPDFALTADQPLTRELRARHLLTFGQAANFIRQLPYGRNADKQNLRTLFADNCGTCSTKHALLKQLADEQGFAGLHLVVGLFRMHAQNTPAVAHTLQAAGLPYLPEAHCYLRYQGTRLDYTGPQSTPADFVADLLAETVIQPTDIADYKVQYHRRYLAQWLRAHPAIKLSEVALWKVREQCIQDRAAQTRSSMGT